MKKRKIGIAGIQETRHNQNSRETNKSYTWLFSGEGGREAYTAGVGIVINNKHIKCIEDIEPIDARLMYITLKGTIPITIIVTYMPPVDRPEEENIKAYNNLQNIIEQSTSKGPMYILGDWNARLIYPITAEEERIMGKHTMHEDNTAIESLTEHTRDNRDMML